MGFNSNITSATRNTKLGILTGVGYVGIQAVLDFPLGPPGTTTLRVSDYSLWWLTLLRHDSRFQYGERVDVAFGYKHIPEFTCIPSVSLICRWSFLILIAFSTTERRRFQFRITFLIIVFFFRE